MPRTQNKLTAKAVLSIDKPGRYADGGGLYLVVEDSGAKRWLLRFQRHGRRRDMGLGAFPDVPLADARDARDAANRQLARGLDPIEERRREAEAAARVVPKLSVCSADWVKSQAFTSEKYRKQVTKRLDRLCGSLGSKRVNEITPTDVVTALRPHWNRVPETAERVLGQIERVLDAAYMAGHIADPWTNPAVWKGRLEHLLPRKARAVRHHRALPYEEIGEFMAQLRKREGSAALALEFAILTAARTSEVRFLTWAEIDEAESRWICPGSRMKMKREHRVPLSPAAMEVLSKAKPGWKAEPGDLVFRSAGRDSHLSDGALERVLDRMEVAVTVHGFRSTFRDWAGDCTEHAEKVVEAALAHSVGDETQRAYRRSDAFEKRRVLMNDWSDYCSRTAGANVIPFTVTSS